MTELEEAGIWIFGELALRQHPEAQELLIVLLQMGEIAGEFRAWHRGSGNRAGRDHSPRPKRRGHERRTGIGGVFGFGPVHEAGVGFVLSVAEGQRVDQNVPATIVSSLLLRPGQGLIGGLRDGEKEKEKNGGGGTTAGGDVCIRAVLT